MHDTLAKIVSHEADKLLKLSEVGARLSADDLEALEILSRCAKTLRADPPPKPVDEVSTEEALKAVGG